MPGRGVTVPGLREARLRALLTQDQLAGKSKVGRATIARLENGDRAATSTVRRLAAALEVTPTALLDEPAPKAEAA